MTRVINLFAGPGAGKSTLAAGLFFCMKTTGYKVELVTEFAKELVYEGDLKSLADQKYVTGEQDARLRRLVGKVDWIINDSPLILAEVYVQGSDTYRADCVADAWKRFTAYNNVNVLVARMKPYQKYGRTQDEKDALRLDQQIYDLTAGMIDCIVAGNTKGLSGLYDFIKQCS